MKKIIALIAGLASAGSALAADGWGMMGGTGTGYGMMGWSSGTALLLGALWFAVAVFVFSVIFWLVHNWLVPKKR